MEVQQQTIDNLWVLVSAGLVFLMQAGFLCLEAGLTRSKNNINVALKNMVDFGITTVLFWLFGYALMFGPTMGGLIGGANFEGFAPDFTASPSNVNVLVFLVFQIMFCGTAVTIISGALAERLNFGSWVIITVVISGLVYPIFGHWVWGNVNRAYGDGSLTGLLGSMGFRDFAGSSVVHSVGGWSSLAILLIIGPRLGRFPKQGPPRTIPGADIPLSAFGVMLLWMGWFGFNGGSTLAMNDQVVHIVANTVLAGAAGLCAGMGISWLAFKKSEVGMVMNGTLAGLVAVTANCFAVTTVEAVIIGAIGALCMFIVDRLLIAFRIDDAVGAVPVHLGAGIWGTLAVGIFGDQQYLQTGLTGLEQIGVQFVGIVVCALWTFLTVYIIMNVINRISPLRVSEEEEHIGLNVSEHGATTELLDLFNVMDEQSKTGDLSLRAPVEPFTEVGQIAARYNGVMASLEEAVKRTDAIVKTALDGIITFSQDAMRINTLNPAAEAMFGYPGQLMVGQPVSKLITAASGSKIATHDYAWLDELLESDHYREVIGRRADGSTFAMEVMVTPALTGERAFYTGTFRDITLRKQAEEAMRRSEEYFRLMIQNASDLISIIDGNGMIRYQSPSVTAILGYEAHEMLEQSIFIFIHANDAVYFVDYLTALIANPDPSTSVEFRIRNKAGEWRVLQAIGNNQMRTSIINGIVFNSRDVTDQKAAERELQMAKEAAEAANRSKSAFLANMSHELRTPLNAIIGYSEMLAEDATDFGYEDIIPDLNKIQSAGSHLLELINSVLDLSKIEAGRMELYLETFEVVDMLDVVVSTISPLIEKNHNVFHLDIGEGVEMLHADLTKVRQTLFNLLSNAAKFTENGTITLSVTQITEDGHDWVLFAVKDTGIGMTPAQVSDVFKEFVQADASTTRKYGGTGLGLTISRRFCQMMGGDILVESELGVGTTFTVVLPRQVAEGGEDVISKPIAVMKSLTGKVEVGTRPLVLVIDDDPSVRDQIARVLEKEGYAIEGASDGGEGLTKALAMQPAAITLDVHMQGMDGWTVLAMLKSHPQLQTIPVIMITFEDDKKRGFAMGASGYLTKPVDRRELLTMLEEFQPDSPTQDADILVVEDDEDTRFVITRILEREHFTVRTAENGLVALERVREKLPDLILLDLMMPEMDGFQFVTELQKTEQGRSVPVIVVTAKDLTNADRSRLNGFVAQIMAKSPSDRTLLLQEISTLLAAQIARK
ncbi:MAG: hypothetical protein OHK0046_02210 [Anaerolineae bacterium]